MPIRRIACHRRGDPGNNGSHHGAPPQFRHVYRRDWQATDATDDRVDVLGNDAIKLDRLPDNVGELRFLV